MVLEDAAARGVVVGSLAELPGFEAGAFPFVDGWQEPIGIAVEGDRVVLQSLGGDVEPGGQGQDLDMVGIFALHDADGAWSTSDAPWLADPMVAGSAVARDDAIVEPVPVPDPAVHQGEP